MLGKIFGGYVGHRIGERYGNNGLRGALLGAGAGAIARRGAGPLALLLAGGYVVRKVLDRRNKGGRRSY
jgi:hypothetical protein